LHRPDADARLSTVSTRLWSLVVDAADPAGLARFWSAALGWPIVFAASDQDEVVVAPAEPLIFTTNYDELIEDAHAAAGLLIRVSANEDEFKNATSSSSTARSTDLTRSCSRGTTTPEPVPPGERCCCICATSWPMVRSCSSASA
jgi:hypothetical protein